VVLEKEDVEKTERVDTVECDEDNEEKAVLVVIRQVNCESKTVILTLAKVTKIKRNGW
jgi:hypothetical protein